MLNFTIKSETAAQGASVYCQLSSKNLKESDTKMEIAKLCMKNVEVRGHIVKRVYGIYVHGNKTIVECPQSFIRELRKGRGQEILDEHHKKDPWGTPPNVNREIDLRPELRKPRQKIWYGPCPHSTEKDMPFEHGCIIYTYGGTLEEIGEFTFFLIGKNRCKRLEECAIYLAEKIGMDPELNCLEGTNKTRAELEIKNAIRDL